MTTITVVANFPRLGTSRTRGINWANTIDLYQADSLHLHGAESATLSKSFIDAAITTLAQRVDRIAIRNLPTKPRIMKYLTDSAVAYRVQLVTEECA